jgi:DNA (cytosine-5)-methyltransferase 1
MSKPLRLLDLFCGAGGAGMGYHRAGFEVVGVDHRQQPRYPFKFIEADAMTFPLDGFDAIHASPPCQDYSLALRHLSGKQPRLIDGVRGRLSRSGKPWVIENVPGSPLSKFSDMFGSHGVVLCGSMFGLRVRRHRLFETSFPIRKPRGCDHSTPALNHYNRAGRERIYAEFGRQDPDPIWNAAMGCSWMNKVEGRNAIPPAYTEFIGRQLMKDCRLMECSMTRYALRPSPSKHQLQVLAWVTKYESLYGRGPLQREIGEAFGVKRAAVQNILSRLEHYGLVARPGSKTERVKVIKEDGE